MSKRKETNSGTAGTGFRFVGGQTEQFNRVFGGGVNDLAETQSKEQTDVIINRICCRYANKYVDKQGKARKLKRSIENLGLIEPIIVLEIDKYLGIRGLLEKIKDKYKEECKDEFSEEKFNSYLNEYLEGMTKNENAFLSSLKKLGYEYKNEGEVLYLLKMKLKGCKYFISSGHRRFKAYVSLALGTNVYLSKRLDMLYTEETAKKIKDYLVAVSLQSNVVDSNGKYYKIPCKIVDNLLVKEERSFYNESNTTQRELTDIEVAINALDTLEENGLLDQFKRNAVKESFENRTLRKLKEKYNDLVKSNIIQKTDVEDDKLCQFLIDNCPYEEVGKTKDLLSKRIVEYLAEEEGKEMSAQVVKDAMDIVELFESNEYMSLDVMSYFLSGLIQAKSLIKLLRAINKAIKEDKAGIIKKDIENMLRNVDDMLKEAEEEEKTSIEEQAKIEEDIIKFTIKEINTISGKNSSKNDNKIAFTVNELTDMIFDIEAGRLTAKEAANRIRNLNIQNSNRQ